MTELRKGQRLLHVPTQEVWRIQSLTETMPDGRQAVRIELERAPSNRHVVVRSYVVGGDWTKPATRKGAMR
jgi:hypothetical protein